MLNLPEIIEYFYLSLNLAMSTELNFLDKRD